MSEEATDLYPYGSLSYGDIFEAIDRGYLDESDLPFGGLSHAWNDQERGYSPTLTDGEAAQMAALTLAGAVFDGWAQLMLGASMSVAADAAAADSRMVTVLGSGRDVAQYANRPGFNVLNMDNLPMSEWPRQNALWLNQAITRGDEIWLVTDPAAHAQLMQQLGKSSYYIDLELPMLNQYSGVNAIPKFVPAAHP